MPEAPKTHTLKLLRGSLYQLVQILATPGTFTSPADLYRAGELLEAPELDLKDAPKEGTPVEKQREWGMVEVDLVVTERQREVCKKGVEYHVGKGGLPSGRYTNRLMRELGLAPED